MTIVTPAQVENRLVVLSKELDAAHEECVAAEQAYYSAKSQYEIGIAAARMRIGEKFANMGVRATVQEKEDEATLETAPYLSQLHTADAAVRAARANVQRIRTQVDIARSVAASVRTSIDMS